MNVGAYPSPLRHFLAQLDELRSSDGPDMREVGAYTHSHQCWVAIAPVRGVETRQHGSSGAGPTWASTASMSSAKPVCMPLTQDLGQ